MVVKFTAVTKQHLQSLKHNLQQYKLNTKIYA